MQDAVDGQIGDLPALETGAVRPVNVLDVSEGLFVEQADFAQALGSDQNTDTVEHLGENLFVTAAPAAAQQAVSRPIQQASPQPGKAQHRVLDPAW